MGNFSRSLRETDADARAHLRRLLPTFRAMIEEGIVVPHEPPTGRHHHDHMTATPRVSETTMAAAVGATAVFVVAEGLAGWFGHSLALLSDAGHNLADAMALAFSCTQCGWQPNRRITG